MANSQYEVLELRFVIKPEWTEAYVLCGPTSDGMIGVQGWHKKIFKKDTPVIDILTGDIARQSYLVDREWSQAAPPEALQHA